MRIFRTAIATSATGLLYAAAFLTDQWLSRTLRREAAAQLAPCHPAEPVPVPGGEPLCSALGCPNVPTAAPAGFLVCGDHDPRTPEEVVADHVEAWMTAFSADLAGRS